MGRPLNKPVVFGILLFSVVVLVGAFIGFRRNPLASEFPNPNGYDDLLRASERVERRLSKITSDEELQLSVSNNAPALALARIGLSRECRVRLLAAPMYVTNLPPLKTLGQAFINEGRLAENDHRLVDATRSYVDAMRLGQAICRGGTIIDCLIGIAIESLGAVNLEKLAPDLPAEARQEVAKALKELQAHRESADRVLRHEHDWSQKTYGLRAQILRFLPAVRKTEKGMVSRLAAHTNRVDRLITKLESLSAAAPQ